MGTPERFTGFWDYYRSHAHGKQGNRAQAVKAWDKQKPSDTEIDTIARILQGFFLGEWQQRGIGIPYASTWLNQRRWEDASEAVPENPQIENYLPISRPFGEDPDRGRYL